ncbi:MAG: exopolyphosphatase [Desulfosarcinaceae bacterium]|nr:exopolyphosphatase [Desulfosarcinaceae bacterium]
MRIITRPDFDGVVCAVLLRDALDATAPVVWTQPNDIQQGMVAIRSEDILANLPFDERCGLWFDHHVSNQTDRKFDGAFAIAPSAAGVVHQYYLGRFSRNYDELVAATDKIDSADLNLEEIKSPERYPYILLSMTLAGRTTEDLIYADRLVDLLQQQRLEAVMADQEVGQRSRAVISQNRAYADYLKDHTRMEAEVSITDFRGIDEPPDGNRFLVYALFPDAVVNVKLYHTEEQLVVKVGHSILNRNCRVNVGKLLARFNGGGHRGAGACRFPIDQTDRHLPQIMAALLANESS